MLKCAHGLLYPVLILNVFRRGKSTSRTFSGKRRQDDVGLRDSVVRIRELSGILPNVTLAKPRNPILQAERIASDFPRDALDGRF